MPLLLLCHFQIFHFVFARLGMKGEKKWEKEKETQSPPPAIPNEDVSRLRCYPDAEGKEHPLMGETQDWTHSESRVKIQQTLTAPVSVVAHHLE